MAIYSSSPPSHIIAKCATWFLRQQGSLAELARVACLSREAPSAAPSASAGAAGAAPRVRRSAQGRPSTNAGRFGHTQMRQSHLSHKGERQLAPLQRRDARAEQMSGEIPPRLIQTGRGFLLTFDNRRESHRRRPKVRAQDAEPERGNLLRRRPPSSRLPDFPRPC